MQNRALDLVSSSYLVARLLAQDKLQLKADKVMGQVNFVDKQVRDNREQAMDVQAIVNRTSGKDPERTFLMYLTGTGVYISARHCLSLFISLVGWGESAS